MPNVALYNIAGQKTGELELKESIFGVEVNESALHTVVKAYLANQRQGTQSALTRAEVRGGGIKIYRQKGTGRARHSSNRAPIFTHGGVVFAPKPRDYRMSVNKKVKRLAMKSALTSKVNDNDIIVYDALDIPAAKTKEMVKVLNAMSVKKALIVLPEKDEIVERAAANIPGVKTTLVGTLNVYEILKYDTLILTKDAVAKIEEVYV
ncbi:MAG: 50S ribosomal protein L4 [Clostridia bacterium]|nr:50S ribosomal protein L4 [Clostridia bacterium]MBQ7114013.1 50S ribosomal protein L4 [Clostridia bacterium]